jgi:hypothetical protein
MGRPSARRYQGGGVMARRILRKFVLNYIAGVDRPAQEPARAVIMKRAPDGAHIGDTKLDYSKIDLGALADVVLEGATTALLKAEPALSREQAFAKVYSDPKYRLAAEAEREASAKRLLAGVPVARLEPVILNDLSDSEIEAIIEEIRAAHPFLDNAAMYRAVANSVEVRREQAAYRSTVSAARREGQRVPQPGDTLTAKRDSALDALTAKADELRKADDSLSEAQAFAAAYCDPRNRDLAKAERLANRPEG